MNIRYLVAAVMLLLMQGVVCADEQMKKKAVSSILNNKGQSIGYAQLTQGTQGVLIEIQLTGLPAGKHGMHFHHIGNCQDHRNFKMAGGHVMPSGKPHGYLHAQGPHEGNLPNLIVGAGGSVHVELYSEMVSLSGQGKRPALLDKDGSALIIHTDQDDHITQPIGGSGARIACGTIQAVD